MISCTLLLCPPSCFVCCSPPDCLAVLGIPRSIPRRCRIPTQNCFLAIPSFFHSQIFFFLSFPWTDEVLGNTIFQNVHRRSDEPFWRKVPSRMTGNSSNFTDANRASQPAALRLFGRGADRATMIEAVSGVSITELAGETDTWRAYTEAAAGCC